MSNEIKSHVEGTMVNIPGGEIVLRDDRIKQKWKVEIKPFLLAKYPVTQDIYFAITKEAPFYFKGDRNPVESISWESAISFCNSLSKKAGLSECYSISSNGKDIVCDFESDGYRLPTEAEWEYACRAGTSEARYGEIDKIAWYKKTQMEEPMK